MVNVLVALHEISENTIYSNFSKSEYDRYKIHTTRSFR